MHSDQKAKLVCTNKTVFGSAEAAIQAIEQINSKPKGSDKRKRPNSYYKCVLCRGYHLTSKGNDKQTIIQIIEPYKKQIEELKKQNLILHQKLNRLQQLENTQIRKEIKQQEIIEKATSQLEKQNKTLRSHIKSISEHRDKLITELLKIKEERNEKD